ncbi:hypothetical protein BKA62DRAFT_788656, partial [Auriculariales sp. MPI-PUGE-AT-0066]
MSATISFYHPFHTEKNYGDGLPMLMAIEQDMCQLSASLREKPEYWRKITDKAICAKWKSEMVQQLTEAGHASYLVNVAADFVLDELLDYAALRDASTGIEVSCWDSVWQSDSLVPEKVQQVLRDGVKILEDVPDIEKDWHPRSDGLVLDLVHPSLYPFVYGQTIVNPPAATRNEVIKHYVLNDPMTSIKHSWLPTDFSINAAGKAQAKGYINNLAHEHTALYSTIENIVTAFVPLFERVLSDLAKPIPQRVSSYERLGEPRDSDCEDQEEMDEKYNEWCTDASNIRIHVPWYSGQLIRVPSYSLRDRDIQVVVKLANIILTPGSPKYPGGSWHIEGMMNERIAASGIYYYDEQNITESRLAFRAAVSEPKYEQNDRDGCSVIWGLHDEETLIQDRGSVATKAGRAIAFPNILQHRVSPFELVDTLRPGHRKILALFLIDPAVHIFSTSDVPMQQRDWFLNSLVDAIGTDPSSCHLAKLPRELLDMIVSMCPHFMTKDQAFKIREELMDERTNFARQNDDRYFRASFSLCEH